MATFTTGRREIVPLRGTDSYIIICEQEGWDFPQDADGNYDAAGSWPTYDPREADIDSEAGHNLRPYAFQPQASNIGVVREGTTIDASYFKGTPIHSKDGEGPATVTGDLTMNVSGNGTGQILRAVLQDKAPVATRVGTYTDDTSALGATTASGTTTTTSFVDDLSTVQVPVPIKVTLDNAVRVTGGQDSGSITLIGTNRWGDAETVELEWTPTEISNGTLTKITTVYFASLTSAEPANFSAGNYSLAYDRPPHAEIVTAANGRLTNNVNTAITLEGTAATFGNTTVQPVYIDPDGATMLSTALFGYVNITGTDAQDRVIVDRVRYQNTTADLARSKVTSAYFKSVTRVTTEGFSAGTFTATAVNVAQNVTFTPSTELPVFWTIESGKGNRPDTYRNVIPSSTSINFSREEPVRVVCSVMGGFAELGQGLRGANTATDRRKLSFSSEDVFSGWQCNITCGNVELAARSATFTIGHNLEASDLLGGKYPPAPPSGAGEREILLTIEMQTDDQNDPRETYDSNTTLDDVHIDLKNVAHGAFPHRLQWQFPSMQITEDPDFVVADFGIVGQTLTLRAIYEAGLEYEFRCLAEYSVWYPVRTYA